ncbi:MAG: hypothetical protein KC421_30500, partial [Anaerolineales bacterium]|nr:hypothetical protein [Anaerolineales bacterium]
PLPLLTAVISNTAVTDDDGTHGIDPTPTNNEDDHQDTVIAAIGDYVWEDLDADGVQNDGNTGINGVTVKLYRDVDGDGIAEPGGDDGVPISTTLTADSGGGDPGYYLFDKLIPGDYFVEFVKPSGYEESVRDVGGDAADSDPNIGTGVTIVTTLTGGEIDLTWDAGFFRPVSIGSFVWEDRNDNGVQDAAEPGIAGATVALLVDNGGFVTAVDVNGNTVSNQTTGADGLYQFTNLPPGDYRVRVTPPADYLPATTQTTTDDDGSESDSNIADEPVSGTYESGTFTLTIDGEPTESGSYAGDAQDDAGDANGNMTVDFGFFQPLSLGSFVWIDANGDGLQDVGETGIENATVALLVYDGISAYVPAVDVDGVLVSAQSTGLDGLYQFENLPLGDYRVRVTPPANYLPSLTQNGSDDDNSEDDSNIADEPVAGTYESGTFTLTSSGEPVESGSFAGDDQDDGRDNDGNMTIDFGFIEPLSIGSLVWEDLDGDGVQDGGEPGIGGAAVALLVDNGAGSFVPATDVDGSLIPGQNTPANGTYRFENLPPGDYRVRVTLPSAYAPTLIQTAVNNDNSEDDSNIADEPIAGTYESGT